MYTHTKLTRSQYGPSNRQSTHMSTLEQTHDRTLYCWKHWAHDVRRRRHRRRRTSTIPGWNPHARTHTHNHTHYTPPFNCFLHVRRRQLMDSTRLCTLLAFARSLGSPAVVWLRPRRLASANVCTGHARLEFDPNVCLRRAHDERSSRSRSPPYPPGPRRTAPAIGTSVNPCSSCSRLIATDSHANARAPSRRPHHTHSNTHAHTLTGRNGIAVPHQLYVSECVCVFWNG